MVIQDDGMSILGSIDMLEARDPAPAERECSSRRDGQPKRELRHEER
jgi:hypothetical protein